MLDECLMEYWFPVVEQLARHLPVKIPKTTCIVLTEKLYRDVIWQTASEADYLGIGEYINSTRIKAGIGLPFFLRTGLSSGKHDWVDTCYITSSENDFIAQRVFNLYESDMMKIGVFMSNHLFIREFIPMNYAFKAFNKMPIAREFRIFSDNGVLTHIQPYWIPDSIVRADKENWKELLKAQHQIEKYEKEMLVKTASRITRKLKGHWSVDFCEAETGEWCLIDMALADVSFKWNPDEFDWDFVSEDEKRTEMEKDLKALLD